MILPLFGGWSDNDVLAKFADLPKPAGPELVKETFKQIALGAAADLSATWNEFLHDGFLAGSSSGTGRTLFFLASPTVERIGKYANLTALSGEGNFEIVFTPDFHTYDGRLQQQRLAARGAGPDHQADMGQRRAHFARDGEGTRRKESRGFGRYDRDFSQGRREVRCRSLSRRAMRTGRFRFRSAMAGPKPDVSEPGKQRLSAADFAGALFCLYAERQGPGNRGVLAIARIHFNMEGRAYVREGMTATLRRTRPSRRSWGWMARCRRRGIRRSTRIRR